MLPNLGNIPKSRGMYFASLLIPLSKQNTSAMSCALEHKGEKTVPRSARAKISSLGLQFKKA